MIGYIYKITNKINGKIYIGQHRSEKFDKYYWGSGKILKKAYKKYGKSNFIREILCWCETVEQLNECEIRFIRESKARNQENGYNIGVGGEKTPDMTGYHHTEETRKRLSISHLGHKCPFKDRHLPKE